MRVRDVMKHKPSTCLPEDSLANAGEKMRRIGCGVLPVVDQGGALTGILTDRDICCALTDTDRRASEMQVVEAMTVEVKTCTAGAPILDALQTMKRNQVRRLPVVDVQRGVEGVLSLDDVAAAAHAIATDATDVTWNQVGAALQAISEHSLPAPVS